MKFSTGGRGLEKLAGGNGARGERGGARVPRRWKTVRVGPDPWKDAGSGEAGDIEALRGPGWSKARMALQEGLLFPTTRVFANPKIIGADDLMHAPQPAVIAPNHSSDIDTPLLLMSLPRVWRANTVVGAAADRFYAKPAYAFLAGLWINTFPFDRGGDLRGLASAATHLREGRNVLLYPQATRSAGALEGFRLGVARLCLATGAPLIPVHLGGTAVVMPKDRGLIQRGRTTVTFGRPLYPGADEEPRDFMHRTEEAISSLAPRRRRSLR